jgi:hypothetical protein
MEGLVVGQEHGGFDDERLHERVGDRPGQRLGTVLVEFGVLGQGLLLAHHQGRYGQAQLAHFTDGSLVVGQEQLRGRGEGGHRQGRDQGGGGDLSPAAGAVPEADVPERDGAGEGQQQRGQAELHDRLGVEGVGDRERGLEEDAGQ